MYEFCEFFGVPIELFYKTGGNGDERPLVLIGPASFNAHCIKRTKCGCGCAIQRVNVSNLVSATAPDS